VRIALIQVPYHLGHEGIGMGAGPERLVETGLAQALEEQGHDVEVVGVQRQDDETNEVGASFAVLRSLSEAVAGAVAREAFPLVLAGNCMSSIAVVAGLGREVGVVWFDAHADFNTPETTLSGFQDGMGLTILTGTSWNALRETIPGYRAVDEANVVLVGIREVDEAERERLENSEVHVVAPGDLQRADETLDRLGDRVEEAYLHVDLDVLDPTEGRANAFAAPGGVKTAEVERIVAAAGERVLVSAAALTAYDPLQDPDGRIPPLAAAIATRIAEAARARAAVQ
jgi:arginase